MLTGCESLPHYKGGLSSEEAWAYAATLPGEAFNNTGNSMEPILHGSMNLVTQYRWDALQPNMIAVFWDYGIRKAHRVLAISGDYFLAAGDNMSGNDGWIHKSNYIGTVVAILPYYD